MSIFCFKSISVALPDDQLTFEWYKNDKLVDPNSSGDWWVEGEFTIGGPRGETFSMVPGFDHTGHYHCLVANEFGTAKSEVVRVVRDRGPER